MTQKLCHLKLRPTEWAHQAKNVCVCVCVYLGVGIFFHKEHHVWGTQDPGETTPAPQHTYLCVTETKSSWNNTWQCVGCFDIISVQYFIFWKCWWQLAAFVFQQFTKSSELWFEKPCSVLHVQLLPQLSCFLSIWSVCSHTSGMLVEFVIVIRDFHSLLSSSERWRGKERFPDVILQGYAFGGEKQQLVWEFCLPDHLERKVPGIASLDFAYLLPWNWRVGTHNLFAA